MAKAKYELRQSRIATEIKFRPNLTYFDDVFKKASKLEKSFNDWQSSHSPLQAVLYSTDAKELLNLGADRIIYITEDNDDFKEIGTKLDEYYKIFLTESNIDTIRRVGARQILLIETSEDFEILADKLYKKFNYSKNQLEEIAVDSIIDFAFVIDGIKNGFKNHLRFGPVKAKEGIQRFDSAFKNLIKIESEGNIFIDIDVFTEIDKDSDDTEEDLRKIQKILSETERITKEINELIKEAIDD